MISDIATIVISTGLGVSVIAGVLSGVCYVFANGFRNKRCRDHDLQWHCIVCGNYLRVNTSENVKVVICARCEERACKQRCSKHRYAKKEWICYNCLKQPSWCQSLFRAIHLLYKKHNPLYQRKLEDDNYVEKILKHQYFNSSQEKEYLKNLLHYLTTMKEDNDDIFQIRRELHGTSTNSESSFTSHTALRLLLEKIVEKAAHQQNFCSTELNSDPLSNTEEQTYEELLSTAILNKIQQRIKNSPPSNHQQDAENNYGQLDSFQYYSLPCNNERNNWRLQKRNIGKISSPVRMLVPNSLTLTKVQIGDKEIDEASDLSETASEEDQLHSTTDFSYLIDDTSYKSFSDEDTSFDSGLRDDSDDLSYLGRSNYTETPNFNYDGTDVFFNPPYIKTGRNVEYLQRSPFSPKNIYRGHIFSCGENEYNKKDSITSEDPEKKDENLFQSINKLEAKYTHSSLPRSLYTSRNTRNNFAKNPLLNFTD